MSSQMLCGKLKVHLPPCPKKLIYTSLDEIPEICNGFLLKMGIFDSMHDIWLETSLLNKLL